MKDPCRGKTVRNKGLTRPDGQKDAREVTRQRRQRDPGQLTRADVRHQLDDTVLTELDGITSLKKRLTSRLAALDTKEDSYLDLIGDPDRPQEKIEAKLAAVRTERAQIEARLADTTTKLDTGRQYFLTALDPLTDPQAMYRRGNDDVEHALAKVIFNKLYVDKPTDDRGTSIIRDTPPKGISLSLQAQAHRRAASHAQPSTPKANPQTTTAPARTPGLSTLQLLLIVELRGIEPLTYSMRTSRATNCATAPEPGVPTGRERP
jgi:site-specific DNA recombinase